MAMHSYLRIDGVAGDSAAHGYEGWIVCDSVSWSLRHPGAGAGTGLAEIRFVKPEDAASPALARLCISAVPLASARFDFLRVAARGEAVKCYEIALENVTVAHVASGPRRAAAMMETVVLTFAKARLTAVTEVDAPGDSAE